MNKLKSRGEYQKFSSGISILLERSYICRNNHNRNRDPFRKKREEKKSRNRCLSKLLSRYAI